MLDYQNQLERMKSLMTYGQIEESNKPSLHTLEYKHIAADGKYYGIVKENAKYYIKFANSGKETIAEAYDYIGGYNNKKNYEYSSYANALKNLEMKLASINEAQDANVNIATLDPFRREEILAEATDTMKDEIARCRQIMYNACMLMNESTAIGAAPFKSQPEAETENSGDKDAPYVEEVKPDMEFDGKDGGCPKCAGAPFDKGEKGEKCECGKDVQVKDSVAGAKPAGGKVVRVNEEFDADFEQEPGDDELLAAIAAENPDFDPEEAMKAKRFAMADMKADDEMGEVEDEDLEDIDLEDEEAVEGEEGGVEEGQACEEDDLDVDFEGEDDAEEAEVPAEVEGEEEVEDDEEMLEPEVEDAEEDEYLDESDPEAVKAEIERLQALLADMEGEEVADVEDVDMDSDEDAEEDVEIEDADSDEDLFDEEGEEGIEDECGMMPAALKEDEEKKAVLDELAKQIAMEMISEDELHVFGQHPGYRKKPMEMPEVGSDENEHGRDWNDASAHKNEPFGQTVGDGKPFDQAVDKLVDQIFENMMKSGILKKK